jgi:hypothetical protein
MEVVGWLLAVLAAGAAFVGWRFYRYPGAWVDAFGPDRAGERRELAAAHRELWSLKLSARRELSAARRGARAELDRYGQRVQAAERELDTLRNPDPGEPAEALGVMTLHQRVLRLGAEEIPLARLTVRVQHAGRKSHLVLTRPDGRTRREVLSHDRHEKAAVQAFAEAVRAAVGTENKGLRRRTEEIAKAEAKVRRVRADTAAHALAERNLAAVVERQRSDPRAEAAERRLEAARKRWEELTTHRPH